MIGGERLAMHGRRPFTFAFQALPLSLSLISSLSYLYQGIYPANDSSIANA